MIHLLREVAGGQGPASDRDRARDTAGNVTESEKRSVIESETGIVL